ncbi:Peripheral-type benzodiazepine receptor-associated protein 1 [Trichinella sp. T6]|nr:Peripheral-type benzodiazepine receptor-associated protein 1 [Trichinella sp. T6]
MESTFLEMYSLLEKLKLQNQFFDYDQKTVNKDCLNATAVVRQRIGQIEEELLSLKQTLEMLNWRSSPESSNKLDRQVQFDVSKSSANSGYQWSGDGGDGAPNRRCRMFNSETEQKKMTSLSRLTLTLRFLHENAMHRTSINFIILDDDEVDLKFVKEWMSSKPSCRLFQAKYKYRPLKDSPNDNPELELPLNEGDLVLVCGKMDEDSFYMGELANGRRGLVPSNYVEPIRLDSLNKMSDNASSLKSLNSASALTVDYAHDANRENNLSFILQNNSSHSTTVQRGHNDYMSSLPEHMCPYPCVDVTNVTVHELRQNDGIRVPSPNSLTVEKQLRKSVLISWTSPTANLVPVLQYHVCIDGVVRTVVPAGYNTKALVEDIDNDKISRLSVRSVAESGYSPDAACTVTIGKDSNVAPQDVRVSSITPVSAQVAWYPGNSNCEHVILLNGLKVGTCPPGIYQILLKGLIPSTLYRCSVRVKDPKAVLEEQPVEGHVDFKTLSKSILMLTVYGRILMNMDLIDIIGLPDAPTNVQCEFGPQDGTLLVTWQPVTTQPKPPSRAAIAGYLVYADGKKISEVDTPTGDHVLLKWADLSDDPPLFITVKAKTREGAISADSNAVRLPKPEHKSPQTAKLIAVTSANEKTSLIPPAMNSYAEINSYNYYTASPNTQNIRLSQTLPTRSLCQSANLSSCQLPMTPSSTIRTAPSYYIFHPPLTKPDEGGKLTERPSLLEMETNYLLRQQQKSRSSMRRRSLSLEDDKSPEFRGQTYIEIPHIQVMEDTVPLLTARTADTWTPAMKYIQPVYNSKSLPRQRHVTNSRAASEPDLRIDHRGASFSWRNRSRARRCLVAMYDYNPKHMSPNYNAVRDELSFQRGQLIRLLEDPDPDGFYLGQINGRIGLVPSNLVVEVKNELRYLPAIPVEDPYVMPFGGNGAWNHLPTLPFMDPYTLQRMKENSAYGRFRRRYATSADYEQWAHSSDPTLSRYVDYETSSGTPDERYSKNHQRNRRMKFKQKSYSLDQPQVDNILEREQSPVYCAGPDDEGPVGQEYHGRRTVLPHMSGNHVSPSRHQQTGKSHGRKSKRDINGEPSEYYPVNSFVNQHENYYQTHWHTSPRYDSPRRSLDRRPAGNTIGYRSSNYNGGRYIDGGKGSPDGREEPPTAYRQRQLHSTNISDSEVRARRNESGSNNYNNQLISIIREAVRTGPATSVVAKFDYDPRILSPNMDAEHEELRFLSGDVITVFGDMDEDGFYVGELNGRYGLVPSNFLELPNCNGPVDASNQMKEENARTVTANARKESTNYTSAASVPVNSGEKSKPSSTVNIQPTISSSKLTTVGGSSQQNAHQNNSSNTVVGQRGNDVSKTSASVGKADGRRSSVVPRKGAQNGQRAAGTTKQVPSKHPVKSASSKEDSGAGFSKMWKKIVE